MDVLSSLKAQLQTWGRKGGEGQNTLRSSRTPPLPPLCTTTSKLENSEELLFVQEALKILAAALKVAGKQGLDNLEIQTQPERRKKDTQ